MIKNNTFLLRNTNITSIQNNTINNMIVTKNEKIWIKYENTKKILIAIWKRSSRNKRKRITACPIHIVATDRIRLQQFNYHRLIKKNKRLSRSHVIANVYCSIQIQKFCILNHFIINFVHLHYYKRSMRATVLFNEWYQFVSYLVQIVLTEWIKKIMTVISLCNFICRKTCTKLR